MAQIKDMQTGADGDNFVVGGDFSVTGTATGVTPSGSDNSTKFATTAFVQSKVGSLGTLSTQNANNVTISGGAITGTTINTFTVGSNSVGAKTISTSAPSGGSNGDIWYRY
jgi:hypothetical protein